MKLNFETLQKLELQKFERFQVIAPHFNQTGVYPL